MLNYQIYSKIETSSEKAAKYFGYLIDRKTYAKNKKFQDDFFKFINHKKNLLYSKKVVLMQKMKKLMNLFVN